MRDDTLPVGEKHHFAKINNDKALEIYLSKGDGSREDRALKFGVLPSVVKKIDSGETWGHITGKHTARIQERNRAYVKRQKISRSDATRDDYENAMQKIREHSIPGRFPGCIETDYCKDERGYGVTYMKGHQTKTHIVSWEYHHNNCMKKPDGLVVRHREMCNNEACVNPDHLVIGTHSDNLNDQYKPTGGRKNKKA